MGVRLRVVLDQKVHVADSDLAAAADDLVDALVLSAPSGCAVDAIVPRGGPAQISGVAEVRRLGLSRFGLAASWQMGVVSGVGGGLLHAPSLIAPFARHDRVHDMDQTTATVWDLRAWDDAASIPRALGASHRALLKRAVRHADAVVVPSHAIAQRLGEIANLGDRIRVIPGAVSTGFSVTADAKALRGALHLPERYLVLTGSPQSLPDGFRAAAAAGVDAVVLDVPPGAEPRHTEIAVGSGLAESRAHARGRLAPHERAAVLAGAMALVATSTVAAWPWRIIEAMTLGVPVVAVDAGVHRDVVADGGSLVDAGSLADAVREATGPAAARLRVLGMDRARAFTWMGAAERVWSLHADL